MTDDMYVILITMLDLIQDSHFWF